MGRVRGGRPKVRIGTPDPSLTAVSGMAAISELVARLGVIEALDSAVGPIKQRDRGFEAGELLVGLAAAQLAGEDFLVGLDRQRADVAGQMIVPVPGLASTTAAGLARRITDPQWRAVESGAARVTQRMLARVPIARQKRLCTTVTVDLDATDVEVYGRRKRGVAYNHQGQRCGRPHVATWAECETVLAAELVSGNDDPRAGAAGLLRRGVGRPARGSAIRSGAAARGCGLFRWGTGPCRVLRRCRVRDRCQADRTIVAVAGRSERAGLGRGDRHGRRPGRGGRLSAGLVARQDFFVDPAGPFGYRAGLG